MAPQNKQKCTKKNPSNTKQSKSPVVKTNVKCPYCNGAGRVAKKKEGGKKKPTSYFPYFFQHIAKRARESNVVQLRKITMQRAAECWRSLTPEQKTDFIRKAQQNLGIAGGRAQDSGPAPGYSRGVPRSENRQNAGPAVAGKSGNVLDEENRQDARPAASEYVFHLASPPKNQKQAKLGDSGDARNTPKDDKQQPLSPFGFFS